MRVNSPGPEGAGLGLGSTAGGAGGCASNIRVKVPGSEDGVAVGRQSPVLAGSECSTPGGYVLAAFTFERDSTQCRNCRSSGVS
jgi:hypothetical protein